MLIERSNLMENACLQVVGMLARRELLEEFIVIGHLRGHPFLIVGEDTIMILLKILRDLLRSGLRRHIYCIIGFEVVLILSLNTSWLVINIKVERNF
jgi:hypothetical protein